MVAIAFENAIGIVIGIVIGIAIAIVIVVATTTERDSAPDLHLAPIQVLAPCRPLPFLIPPSSTPLHDL